MYVLVAGFFPGSNNSNQGNWGWNNAPPPAPPAWNVPPPGWGGMQQAPVAEKIPVSDIFSIHYVKKFGKVSFGFK